MFLLQLFLGNCINIKFDFLAFSAPIDVTLDLAGNDEWAGEKLVLDFTNSYKFEYTVPNPTMTGTESQNLGTPTSDNIRYF